MYVRDRDPPAGLLVLVVVDEADEGLQDEEGDYGCSEYGVGAAGGFVEPIRHLRQPNTHTEAT